MKERVRTGSKDDIFSEKARIYVDFVNNPGNITDPAPDATEPDDHDNPKNLPGR